MSKLTYRATVAACFVGYAVQAIVINFLPLLFVTMERDYGFSVGQITSLITVNFLLQLFTDLTSPLYVDRLGYRRSVLLAHVSAAAGLLLLPVLPEVMPPYAGVVCAVLLLALGGGLIEVLINPIVESGPGENKEKAISLLHSFYCWGHMGVVLLSTVFFALFGIGNWKIMSMLWALVPAANAVVFTKAPISVPPKTDTVGGMAKTLLKTPVFYAMLLMMFAAGAAEQAVSQWTSAFAEQGLGVSKTVGDLTGTMLFAALMGVTRALYGKKGDKLRLESAMAGGAALCVAAYLTIGLTPYPILGLLGCAVCGFGVGIFWPGSISLAAARIKNGGTAMYALLALAGDLGCTLGPTLAGAVGAKTNMQTGILSGIVFPVLLLAGLAGMRKVKK
ncbi:MAG: MFS transporter [Clostridia bacterium]|nr:MFS transporter [Clostridia bacterium]